MHAAVGKRPHRLYGKVHGRAGWLHFSTNFGDKEVETKIENLKLDDTGFIQVTFIVTDFCLI